VASGLLRLNGREVTLPAQSMGSLRVSRKVYSPANLSYARFLELIENPTATPQPATVVLYGNMGSDGNTRIINTSSGDQMFTVDDHCLLTDDSSTGSGGSDPAVAHLFAGPGSKVKPSAVSLSGDSYSMTFTLTLQPYSRQVLMHYAVQHHNHNEVQRILDELSAPDFEEEGLTQEEHRQLVNWSGLVDSDGDGMPDAHEIPRGLDPTNPDWDSDGIPDGQDSETKVADQTAHSIAVERSQEH